MESRFCRGPLCLLVLISLIASAQSFDFLNLFRLRSKRQVYPVHLGGVRGIMFTRDSKDDSGPWTPFEEYSACSRSCGLGVKLEIRTCSGGGCKGSDRRYSTCNTDPCPEGSVDARAEQCALQNDKPLEGIYHKWTPFYNDRNKCALECQPEGLSWYYKFADKVADGTRCTDSGSNDVCVDGHCVPVGCDNKMLSTKKEDKCLVCDGDGSTCKSSEGFFESDDRALEAGYHDILTIPAGATSIKVSEREATSNYIALRNSSGGYVLNGNWKFSSANTNVFNAAGTSFTYDTRNSHYSELLQARGPTNEDITVAIVYQGTRGVIEYEFSMPINEADFIYNPADWSECSVTCGAGVQTRELMCLETATNALVDASVCEENNASKPETEKNCTTINCDSSWFTGDWEDCSHSCGDSGQQYRVVYCQRVFADGRRITVDDGECTDDRPQYKQVCNRFECPEWNAGPWSACSKPCGQALQFRSVTCRSEKEGDNMKLLPAAACNVDGKPDLQRSCNLGPCDGLRFVTSDWQLCTKCNDTTETRTVKCEDESGRQYLDDKCSGDRPLDQRSCATPVPCIYKWQASQWSECSTQCGHGHQDRGVVCAIDQEGALQIMDDSHCDPSLKPASTQNCTNEDECTGTYMTGPWGECSASCAGGTQTRSVVCFTWDLEPDSTMCDELEVPVTEQECNPDPCPTCGDSEFGCCPDNSTFATGDFNEGCSNCSLSEFGCCNDNVTEAMGPDGKGCPGEEEEEMKGGSGEGEESADSSEAKADAAEVKMCTYNNEKNGNKLTVPCVQSSDQSANLILGNDTSSMNETDTYGNATLHCSRTEFGCCPDWYTPAQGSDNAGCPEYELGVCNETKFGCCPDNITLSRGENNAGCGSVECSGSLYGCCKDRNTIAFGPHYDGCERASFPCEKSEFGCCPDGETAALGSNGKGCESSCLLSQYGCCPDGQTPAEGPLNKGCGCAVSPFGCCPDGETAASGNNFQGCPSSCAQSQYGCCPDGKTASAGPDNYGCPCQYTQFRCCPDGETTARDAEKKSCDDCRFWKFGCCWDGVTKAQGTSAEGCPATTPSPLIIAGTVSPSRIAACTLEFDAGTCSDWALKWYYDKNRGQCLQKYYGGCDGNDNRFDSKEDCLLVCVQPPGRGVCYLPKIEGDTVNCARSAVRYYYNATGEVCTPFYYRDCGRELANRNNFKDHSTCNRYCRGVGIDLQSRRTASIRQPQPVRPTVPQATVAAAPPPIPYPGDVCLEVLDSGPCRSYVTKWFYERNNKRCETFIYGGCGGTANKFNSKEECEQRCQHLMTRQRETTSDTIIRGLPVERHLRRPDGRPHQPERNPREACDAIMSRGSCKGNFEKFYYEKATGTCESFSYSGCGGTANKFHSLADCERTCVLRNSHTAAVVSVSLNPETQKRRTEQSSNLRQREEYPVCHLAADPGFECNKRASTQWYYKKSNGVCTKFMYSGCGGNGNRFDTESQCLSKCSNFHDPCSLPKVSGPCKSAIPSFYYDRASQRCLSFLFGGCFGNNNNFESFEECQRQCVSGLHPPFSLPTKLTPIMPNHVAFSSIAPRIRSPIAMFHDPGPAVVAHIIAALAIDQMTEIVHPFCALPLDPGPCTETTEAYYYDAVNSRCRPFQFGGCQGNENRFSNLEICRLACSNNAYYVDMRNSRNKIVPQTINAFKDIDINVNDEISQIIQLTTAKPSQTSAPVQEETMNSDEDISNTIPEVSAIVHVPPVEGDSGIETCSLPQDVGSCNGQETAWYYDIIDAKCLSFVYSGCGGNPNRFSSEQECQLYCGRKRVSGMQTVEESKIMDENRIISEAENIFEPNKEVIVKMDAEEGIIEQVGEEENRIEPKEQEGLGVDMGVERPAPPPAVEYPMPTSILPDLCSLGEDKGACFGSDLMWMYDSEIGKCRGFLYSGCGGNANKFSSEESCMRACGLYRDQDVCKLPSDIGSCELTVNKWYYDADEMDCLSFLYTGCAGNGNRFSSKEECLNFCHESEPSTSEMESEQTDDTDSCTLAMDAGPCMDPVSQWYFDSALGKCKLFTYGGCRGNANRFNDKETCQATCSKRRLAALQSDRTICGALFDAGPCRGTYQKYYYDIGSGLCKSFTYGGCKGNGNRFETKDECARFCTGFASPTGRSFSEVQVFTEDTTVQVGDSIELECRVRDTTIDKAPELFTWFKDGNRVNTVNDRMFQREHHNMLIILSVLLMDAGHYSCAADIGNAIVSDSINISVQGDRDPSSKGETTCVDAQRMSNCPLVVRAGLCDHKVYGKDCCASCSNTSASKWLL